MSYLDKCLEIFDMVKVDKNFEHVKKSTNLNTELLKRVWNEQDHPKQVKRIHLPIKQDGASKIVKNYNKRITDGR